MNKPNLVQEHYAVSGMSTRIENALLQAGFELGLIDWADLAPLDHIQSENAIRVWDDLDFGQKIFVD